MADALGLRPSDRDDGDFAYDDLTHSVLAMAIVADPELERGVWALMEPGAVEVCHGVIALTKTTVHGLRPDWAVGFSARSTCLGRPSSSPPS